MRQVMLAAPASGSGKTTLACGLLLALRRRGCAPAAFKCGPDYIDPMFHTRVLGVPSQNLDLFLQGEPGARRSLAAAARRGAAVAVLEGAMGYYDGIAGTDAASAWQTACALGAPTVLVLRPEGASLTLAAQVQGLQRFRAPSHLRALLLNGCKASLFAHLKPLLERETGLPVLGFLPRLPQAEIPSRHLGLLTAGEIEDFAARYAAVARALEENVDLDRLLMLAEPAPLESEPEAAPVPARCTIAVARDEAFCFYYADSLDALRASGAQIRFFSPLRDAALPPEADGLYLGGGYPELHAEALSRNEGMRRSIRQAIAAGLPTVAECGGFLYLQERLTDDRGRVFPMAGALPGLGVPAGGLRRFGYALLRAEADSLLFRAGEEVPAHEFHHWDSDACGDALSARKPGTDRAWRCAVVRESLYAGFPHLHFGGERPLAERFAAAAANYGKERCAHV